MFINVQRKDKEIARVELPDGGEDLWGDIEKNWPHAYDLIFDGSMIVPGEVSRWSETFYLGGPEADERLCVWILGGAFMVEDVEFGGEIFQTFYETCEEAVREAERAWDYLTPRERSKRHILACTYRFEDQIDGALPSFPIWESDSTEVHRKVWPVFFNDGDFEAWGEGRDMSHPVQSGTLYALPFEVEYEFDDGEEVPHDADDQYWLAHVASIRWVRE